MPSHGIALLAVAGSAVAYGLGSVLQAISATRTEAVTNLDPRLLARLVGQLPYAAGLALDAAGFALNVLALRTLPLFFVQSVIAGSVGVTAVAATFVFDTRLRRGEVLALGGLCGGLVLLAVAAQPGRATPLSRSSSWLLVASVAVVAAVAAALSRRKRGGAVALAAVAGAGFAGVGIAARGLPAPKPLWHAAAEPAAWALVGFGAVTMLTFAIALQRGGVTVVCAVMFAVETGVPAVVGLAWLGDATRSSTASVLAAVGFALTLTGAVGLTPYAAPVASVPSGAP